MADAGKKVVAAIKKRSKPVKKKKPVKRKKKK